MRRLKNIGLFLTAIMLTTTALSQKVSIDSTGVVLDRKATIAIGNLLREGNDYKELFKYQSVLVDSLFIESNLLQKKASTQSAIISNLDAAMYEKDKISEFKDIEHEASIDALEYQLKKQKWRKWTFLLFGMFLGGVGVLFGI